MKVDIDSRLHCRLPASGSAAFVPKHWPKRRLPDRENRLLADFCKSLHEADSRGRFSFSCWSRRDRRDHDQFGFLSYLGKRIEGNLCLIVSVGFEYGWVETEVGRKISNWSHWEGFFFGFMWFGPAYRTRSCSNVTILPALGRVGTHLYVIFSRPNSGSGSG